MFDIVIYCGDEETRRRVKRNVYGHMLKKYSKNRKLVEDDRRIYLYDHYDCFYFAIAEDIEEDYFKNKNKMFRLENSINPADLEKLKYITKNYPERSLIKEEMLLEHIDDAIVQNEKDHFDAYYQDHLRFYYVKATHPKIPEPIYFSTGTADHYYRGHLAERYEIENRDEIVLEKTHVKLFESKKCITSIVSSHSGYDKIRYKKEAIHD